MNRLQISPEARNDLLEIKNYITQELENPNAAQKTVSKIIETIRGLVEFPNSGIPLSSIIMLQIDYRFVISGRYLIFYRQEGETIYVLRVLYGRRDYMNILLPHLLEED